MFSFTYFYFYVIVFFQYPKQGKESMEKTPKNIKVDPELWRKARARALVEGMTLQELMTKLLKEYVEGKKR